MLKKLSLITIALIFAFTNATPITYEKSPMEGDFFEGDIANVDITQVAKGMAQLDNIGRNKWPLGTVPYRIDTTSGYTQAQIDTILGAMRLIENQTRSASGVECIKFVPQTTQNNWIKISALSGCYSNVGKNTAAGEQIVSLARPGCIYTGIIAHELTHALGFWHEQSRPDRDNYVNIFWQNIDPSQQYNFDKYTANIDLQGFPYDYDSVMHYHPTSFSINGQATITPKVDGVTIGNKNKLSDIDVAEIRKYYKCA